MRKWLTRRSIGIFVGLMICLLVAGELFARWGLGLGDPPLSTAHPTIEYMFAPNQDRMRFGNRFATNAYGMRSSDFPETKSSPDELRVIVLGDSIINGGNQVDQSQIMTEVLKRSLAQRLDRPIVVGNVSAGSWGPKNLLAYIEEFGLFDADIILLVLNTYDFTDLPKFGPLSPSTHPTKTPFSALWEGATRYLPRYLPSAGGDDRKKPQSPFDELNPQKTDAGEANLRALIAACKESDAQLVVIQHLSREEFQSNRIGNGTVAIAELMQELEVPVVTDAEALRGVTGQPAYQDSLHPTSAGHAAIATVLEQATLQALQDKPESIEE